MVRVSAAILAGGASRRMGFDKRSLVIDGEALLARAVRTAMAVSEDVLVVSAADRPVDENLLSGLKWRPVVDRRPSAGPLAGLEAALVAALHPMVVALAVDAPGVTPALLRLLIARTETSGRPGGLFMSDAGPQPLPCVLRTSALERISDLLDAGERRMSILEPTVPMAVIEEADWRAYDPAAAWLMNVNQPQDLINAARR